MSRRFGGRNLPPRQTRPRPRVMIPPYFDPFTGGFMNPFAYNPAMAAYAAAAYVNPMAAVAQIRNPYGYPQQFYAERPIRPPNPSFVGNIAPPSSSSLAKKRTANDRDNQDSSDDDYATDEDSDEDSKQTQPQSKKQAQGEGVTPNSSSTTTSTKRSSKTPYNHPGVTEKQCELCGVVFTSKVLRDQHLKGKKHKKKLKFHMNKGETPFDVPDSPDGDDEADAAEDGNDEDVDESGDVEMEVLDPHLEFSEELKALRGAILDPENAERISINAFQLFRIMEEYLRYITRRYVSPGIDPTRMSWNELLNVLKRNTIVKLSSNMERKLDNVRQLRNSVVHSFTAPVDIRVLTKVIKIAEEMYEWGVQFRDTTL